MIRKHEISNFTSVRQFDNTRMPHWENLEAGKYLLLQYLTKNILHQCTKSKIMQTGSTHNDTRKVT